MRKTFILLALLSTAAAWPAGAADQSAGVTGDWLDRYTDARSHRVGRRVRGAGRRAHGHDMESSLLSLLYQNEAHFELRACTKDTGIYGFGFAMPSRHLPSFAVRFFP